MKKNPEKKVKKTDEEMTQEMAKFLKMAFCIDGECSFISLDKINVNEVEIIQSTFLLTDSRRGEFYSSIGMKSSKKTEKQYNTYLKKNTK
jgi:hypothetical protein